MKSNPEMADKMMDQMIQFLHENPELMEKMKAKQEMELNRKKTKKKREMNINRARKPHPPEYHLKVNLRPIN